MPENEEIREDPASIKPENEPPPQKAKTRKNSGQQAQMLIKRSVSPDGRIDSVSVEFATPVSELSNGEIKEKAVATMKLQKEIVGSFLLLNGEKAVAQPTPEKQPQPSNVEEPDGRPVPARMIDLGKVNGKWGERFCINFQVNGRRSRLFGSVKQIAGHIAAAGYEMDVENVQEGLRLNLPCRVITKLSDDGKYLNVEQVLPPVRNLNAGGANGRNHN